MPVLRESQSQKAMASCQETRTTGWFAALSGNPMSSG